MFSITYWATYCSTNFSFAPKTIVSNSEDDDLREYKNKNMVIKTLKMEIDAPCY
jgi:hypothetical protein